VVLDEPKKGLFAMNSPFSVFGKTTAQPGSSCTGLNFVAGMIMLSWIEKKDDFSQGVIVLIKTEPIACVI